MNDFGRSTRAVAGAAESMTFDEFMQYDPSGGSGGAGGFFKWKDQKRGQADVWLHTKRPCVAFPNHSWKKIVEVKDKETGVKEQRVFTDRWGCHESKEVIENQYFRDKQTGQYRQRPPVICPLCLFVEHCFQQVFTKQWEPTKAILSFQGSRRDECVTFSAGSICGWFTDKRFEQDPGLARKCKMAGIRRDEVWKEKLLTQKQFLFTLVSDTNPGNGVQASFEKVSLTKAVLKAIEDEKTKEQRKRTKGNVELADPSKNPYRFAWEFDGDRDINSMYSCVALRDGEPPPGDILELITSDPPDVSHLISEGDSYALRGQMEAHLCEGVELPWDEIFGPAERVGKMRPPAESRSDEDGEEGADDEDPGEFFERKAAEVANPPDPRKMTTSQHFKVDMDEFRNAAQRATKGGTFEMPRGSVTEVQQGVSNRSDTSISTALTRAAGKAMESEYSAAGLVDEPVVVPVDSPVWAIVEKGGVLPLPAVKGREVHLDVPEGTEDRTVEKLRAMLEKLGATAVAEVVPCEHCGEPMTTLDNECPKCAAQIDDRGILISRPCLKVDCLLAEGPICKGQVPVVPGEGEPGEIGRSICPKCGTVHEMADGKWTIVIDPKQDSSSTQRRSRRGGAPPFARAKSSAKNPNDDIPY